MATTARGGQEPYTGPDTSAQLIALQQLEHIAVLQNEPADALQQLEQIAVLQTEPAKRTAVLDAPTQADPVAPWSDAEAYAPALAPERTPARHGRSDLEKLLDRWRRLPLIGRLPLPLVVTLLVQAGLSLRLIWSNTAFADESLYLWAGHLEWAHWELGTSIKFEALPTFFSGSPVIYPPLGALADGLGGLAAARVLSLLFMLGTTTLLYATTRRLFDSRSACCAAALFAGASGTQFLGAFATYDAMALFLLALAMWAAVRAAACRSLTAVILLSIAAGAAMALADATKYAATLWDPIVIGVGALALWRSSGWRRAVVGSSVLLAASAGLIAAGVWAGGHDLWVGISRTTLARGSGAEPMFGVLFNSGKWVGVVAFLAICGAVTAGWGRDWRSKLIAALLAFAVLLAPVEQARIHTLISLFKHVDYGAFFACVLAGYALASLARAVPVVKRRAADRVSAGAIVLAGVIGFAFAGAHFAGWPNSSQLISQITPVINRVGCPCLATQNNTIDYYLRETDFSAQPRNAFGYLFLDWRTGRTLHDTDAVVAAIQAHYLNVVEIDPSQDAAVYWPALHALRTTPGYQLVGTSPSGAPGAPAEIWVLGG